jgi:hypothetical protein
MRLLCWSVLRALAGSTLLACLTLPVAGLGQSLSPELSEVLRGKVLDLKGDLALGDYRLATLRAVELGVVLAHSPKAAEMKANVDHMASEPTLPENLAQSATAPLVPAADRLLQAIDAGDAADVRDRIFALLKGIGEVYQAELKRKLANRVPGSDARGEHYLALKNSLLAALVQNSVPQSVALATEFQAVVADQKARHEWNGYYDQDLYVINDAFGRAAFGRGDYDTARDYLLKQTEIPPQELSVLCCFGPNMWLAQSLLRAGYRDDVLTFLQGIGALWTKDSAGKRDAWIADLKKGIAPDMAPNNDIGHMYRR